MSENKLMIEFLGGVSKELLSGLTALQKGLKSLADTAKTGGNLSAGLDEMGASLATMLEKTNKAFTGFDKMFKKIGTGVDSSVSQFKKLDSTLSENTEFTKKLDAAHNKLNVQLAKKVEIGLLQNLAKLYSTLERIPGALKENQQDITQWAVGLDIAKIAELELNGAIYATVDGFRAKSAAVAKDLNLTNVQYEALRKYSAGTELYAKTLADLKRIEKETGESTKTFTAALRFFGQTIGMTDDQAKTYVPQLLKIRNAIEAMKTSAKTMQRLDLLKMIDNIKPTQVLLRQMDGSLQVTKDKIILLNDSANTIFSSGTSKIKIKGIVDALQLIPVAALNASEKLKRLNAELSLLKNDKGKIDSFDSTQLASYRDRLGELLVTLRQVKGSLGVEEYTRLKQEILELSRATDIQKTKIKERNSAEKQAHEELRKISSAYKEIAREISVLEGKNIKTFNTAELKRYNSELGKLYARLDATKGKVGFNATEYKNLETRITSAREASAKYTEAMNPMHNALDMVNRKLKTFASYLAASFLVGGFVLAIRSAIQTLATFDQALATFQAVLQITRNESELFGQKVIEIAQRTQYSAKMVSEGFTLLGQAGFSSAEALQAIDPIANLAAGTLEGFKSVVDLTTTTLRAFNLDAVETGRVADIMATAINKSKLDVEKLSTAFNYIGAAGRQAGLTLNDTTGAMMILSNAGIKASTMATGLRSVLLDLIAPNSELSGALNDAGLSYDDINPKLVGFANAIQKVLPLIWDKTTSTVDMGKAEEYFGKRAAQVAGILAEAASTGHLQTMINQTREQGAAAEMAAKQNEGLIIKYDKLKNTLGTLAIAIGNAGLTPILKYLTDGFQAVTEKIADLINEGGPVTSTIMGITTSAGALTVAILGVAGALKVLGIYVFGEKGKLLLEGMIALFKSPLLWIPVAIGAIATLIYKLETWDQKAAETAEKQASAFEQSAASMQGWQKTIGKISVGSASSFSDFNDALMRIKKESPEVAKTLEDKLGVSFETVLSSATKGGLSLEQAIQKVSTAMKDSAIDDYEKSIEKQKEAVIAYSKELIHMQKEVQKEYSFLNILFSTLTGNITPLMATVTKATEEDIKKQQTLITAATQKIADDYFYRAKVKKQTKDEALKDIDAEIEADDKLRGSKVLILEKIEELFGVEIEKQKEYTSQLKKTQGEYNNFYKSLDDAGKKQFNSAFVKAKADAEDYFESLEEMADKENLTDQQRQDVRLENRKMADALVLTSFKEHVQKIETEAEKEYRAYEKTYQRMVSENELAMAEIDLQVAQGSLAVQEAEDEKLAILQKANEDKINNLKVILAQEFFALTEEQREEDESYIKHQADLAEAKKEGIALQIQAMGVGTDKYKKALEAETEAFEAAQKEREAIQEQALSGLLNTLKEHEEQRLGLTKAEAEEGLAILKDVNGKIIGMWEDRAGRAKKVSSLATDLAKKESEDIITYTKNAAGEIIAVAAKKADGVKKVEQGMYQQLHSLLTSSLVEDMLALEESKNKELAILDNASIKTKMSKEERARVTSEIESKYAKKAIELEQNYVDNVEKLSGNVIQIRKDTLAKEIQAVEESVAKRLLSEEEGEKQKLILTQIAQVELLATLKNNLQKENNLSESEQKKRQSIRQAIIKAIELLEQESSKTVIDITENEIQDRLALYETEVSQRQAIINKRLQYISDDMQMELLLEDEKQKKGIQTEQETALAKLKINQEYEKDKFDLEMISLQKSLSLAKEKEAQTVSGSLARKNAETEIIGIETQISAKREEMDRNEIENKNELIELEKTYAKEREKNTSNAAKAADAIAESLSQTRNMVNNTSTAYSDLAKKLERVTLIQDKNNRLASADFSGARKATQNALKIEIELLSNKTRQMERIAELAKTKFGVEIDYTGMNLEGIIEEFRKLEQQYSEVMQQIKEKDQELANDRTNIRKEMADQIAGIEQSLADKIKSINDSLADKLRSIEEKKFNIGLEGLSDEQKQTEYRKKIKEEWNLFVEAINNKELEQARIHLDALNNLEGHLTSKEERLALLNAMSAAEKKMASSTIDQEQESAKKQIEITKNTADEKLKIVTENTAKIRKELMSLDGIKTTSTHKIDVLEEVKRIAKEYATGGMTPGPSHAAGGKDINVEGGEYIIPKKSTSQIVRDYGWEALESLRRGFIPIVNMFKNGGPVFPKTIQAPKLSFATGGSVPSFAGIPNLGSLNLNINNQEIGKIYAEPNVLDILSKQIKKQGRLRSN